MGSILKSIIDRHVKDREDFALISKVSFIYIYSFVGVSITLVFGIINIMTGQFNIGLTEIILSLMQISNIIYFLKKNNIVLTTNILNTILYILFSALIIHGGIEETGIYWIALFPLIVYFMDNKYSKYWIILFILTTLVIATLDYFHILNTPYNFVQYRQAIIEFSAISFILHFYHNVIIFQREELIKSKNKFKEQEILAKASDKSKSEFLANMSHEIRTPLNAILGFVGILKEDEKESTKLKYLTTIYKSSQSLLGIINDILDFSKIESGKIAIDKVSFESKEEFGTVAELFKAKADEKGISFDINIDSGIPKYLKTDIQKLRQIISNLLSNAIKFTNRSKKVELKIYYSDEKLFVSVKDEGIGIAEEKQKSIFKEFAQADSTTTRKFGGTGLGLSIASSFVELLGGVLELQSIKDQGSEFYFSIPTEIGKEPKVIIDNLEDITFEDKKVLLVEDNKANQMFMKILLKQLKLKFDIAKDGLEAIEKFKLNRYDSILMDENMPNMSGIEAVKQIVEIERQGNLVHTPIIALTANALKGDREKFLAAGMDEYLSKPVDKKRLREVLKKVLMTQDGHS